MSNHFFDTSAAVRHRNVWYDEEEELATDAIAELEGAVEELNAVLALLENGGKA